MNFSTIKNSAFITKLVARLTSEEQGHGLLEMALVLMFLLPLTFGMIDASRCIYTNSVVQAAAQEGARAGIIDAGTIRTAVESKLIGLDMANANINIDTTQENIVAVSISYDFVFVTPMVDAFINSLNLTGSASMVSM